MRSLMLIDIGYFIVIRIIKRTEYPLKGAGKQSRHSFMLSESTDLSRVSDRRRVT